MKNRVTIALWALLALPALSSAQGDKSITIRVSTGGVPEPSVPVYWFVERPVLLGTTAENGTLLLKDANSDLVRALLSFQTGASYSLQCSSKVERKLSVYYTLDGELRFKISDDDRFGDWFEQNPPDPGCKLLSGGSVLSLGDGRFDLQLPLGSFPDRTLPGGRKRFFFDTGIAPKQVQYSGFGNGLAQITAELRERNYNQFDGTSDDTGQGWYFDTGVNARIKEGLVRVRVGFQGEDLGTASSNVTASRINVPNTPSNVVFSSRTDLQAQLYNIVVGVPICVDRFTFSANLAPGWARVRSTTSSTLVGGPQGPTPPTTQVSSTTNTTKATKFGLGWNAGIQFDLGRGVNVSAQYQARNIRDVFAPGNEGRLRRDVTIHGWGAGISFMPRAKLR